MMNITASSLRKIVRMSEALLFGNTWVGFLFGNNFQLVLLNENYSRK